MSIPRFRPARTSQQKYRRIILFRPRIGNEGGGEHEKYRGIRNYSGKWSRRVCGRAYLPHNVMCVFSFFFRWYFSPFFFLHRRTITPEYVCVCVWTERVRNGLTRTGTVPDPPEFLTNDGHLSNRTFSALFIKIKRLFGPYSMMMIMMMITIIVDVVIIIIIINSRSYGIIIIILSSIFFIFMFFPSYCSPHVVLHTHPYL